MEVELQKLENEHDWCFSLKPYFIHQNVMYFSKFENDFEKKEIRIKIEQFDFEK